MNIFRVVLFLLIFGFGNVVWGEIMMPVGQKEYDGLMQKYQALQYESDDNEKNYLLSIYAKEMIDLLESKKVHFLMADSLLMQKETTVDGHFTVLVYPVHFKSGKNRLEWFVLSIDDQKTKAYYFKDDIKIGKGKNMTSAPRVGVDIVINSFEDENFYSVSFFDKNNPLVFKEIADLKAKCLFEGLSWDKPDEEKLLVNDLLLKRMGILWKQVALFQNKLTGFTRMSTLISEDKRVKLCTWNIEMNNGTYEYFGAVMTRFEKGIVKVYPLNDYTEKLRSPTRATLSHKKWYGAVYYDIVQVAGRNKSTYYTLLGFKGNNEMTKIRVVDLLWFPTPKSPSFGYSLFQSEKVVEKRMVFEYSAGASMMLRYDSKLGMIVMDHLAPSESVFKDNPRFYGPDFSYDGLKYEKGRWVLYPEIDLRNPKIKEPAKKK